MGLYRKAAMALSALEETLQNQPMLVAVRRGLTYMIPLLLVGSMALIFLSLPIPFYQNAMDSVFGSQWRNVFLFVRNGTFNILGLLMTLCISYSYVTELGEQGNPRISPIIAAAVSLSCFMAVSGIGKSGFSVDHLGVTGVFTAMAVAVTSSMLFVKLSSAKLFRIKAFTDGANSTFQYAITAIYPAMITIAFFAGFNQALVLLFGISDIPKFVSDVLCGLFAQVESPFWSALLFVGLVHIFWFFGMHGSNILEPVARNLFVPALTENQVALSFGKAPTEIFTKTFFDTFVLMGGCGTTLCLLGAILIVGKYKNQQRLAKLAMIPVIFNINELLIFGIPLVLNPIFIIPFLCTPIILTIVSYWAALSGFVPYTIRAVEWTTPIFLSGYMSTLSINASILQGFNLALGILCYIPFVKVSEGAVDAQMRKNLNKVYARFKQDEERGVVSTFLARPDDIGNVARFLAADLEHALKNNRISLFYQPQVRYAGNVYCVEALLRWHHPCYGYIYPPLVLALAEEAHLVDELGLWIMDTACGDLRRLVDAGSSEMTMSVNVTAAQLENEGFAESVKAMIGGHGIRAEALTIEITEQVALAGSAKIINQILALKALGIKLAMDDFGMGHSSLMYLKEHDFDTVKLDGSLVREILSNGNCCNIISSIVYLGKSLNYSVVAEYVEVEGQRELLHELGCDRYQGYLYSPAVPFDLVVSYIQAQEDGVEITA